MKQDARIIAIVGMAGSGKSVVAQFFNDKGIPTLRFGDQTDIGLKEFGLPRNEQNERIYREKIRQELGMAAMAIKIEPRIRAVSDDQAIIILDGLMSWEEYIYLLQKFPSLKLLHVATRPEVRYARLSQRSERPLTQTEARGRDFAEIEKLNKGGPIAIADLLIENNDEVDALHAKLEALLKNL